MKVFALRKKLVTVILIFVFVFGMMASYATFVYSKNILFTEAENDLKNNTIKTSDYLRLIFSNSESLATHIAVENEIIDYVSGSSIEYQNSHILTEHLALYNINNDFSAIYLLNKDGVAIVSTDSTFVGKNYGFREYFKQAINGNKYVDVVFGVTSKELGFYFSYPIKNKNNEIIGVVVLKMRPGSVSENLLTTNFRGDFDLMITDSFGVVVLSNKSDRIYKSLGLLNVEEQKYITDSRRFEGIEIKPLQYGLVKEKIKFINNQQVELIKFYDYEDKTEELLSVSRIGDYNLFLIIEEDYNRYIAFAKKEAYLLSLFVILSAITGAIMMSFATKFLLKTLDKINAATKKVSEGDYSVHLEPDHTSVEFDNLVRAFNDMIEDVKKSRESITKQVKLQTKKILEHSKEMEAQQKAVLNILDDVEVEKNNAENLAADLSKFKLAVESASDHIIITDKNGKVLYMNKAAENITGYTFADVIGNKAGALWGGLMGKDFYKKLWDTILLHKQSFYGEIKNRRKNGEEYDALISVAPILDEKNEVTFFVGIERDVTHEKEIDRAKTEFVSLASHQLRTPLSTIGWYTEMMLSGDAGKLSDDQRNYLLEIAAGNRRMVNLVNSLLNVSRIEVGTFVIETEDVDIQQIAEQSLGELKPLIEKKKIVLNKSFESGINTIKADPKLLKIIFDNLLSNAVKYTSKEGNIDFSIKKEKKEIIITVKDDGIGIPKAQQHEIYTKLFRADNAREIDTDGTGLGLYIVKSILDEAGGKVTFKSEENKGSVFTVSLPEKGMKKREGVKSLL